MNGIKLKFGPLANFEFDKLFLGQVFSLLCIRDFDIKYRKFDMQVGSLRFLAKFKQHLKAV